MPQLQLLQLLVELLAQLLVLVQLLVELLVQLQLLVRPLRLYHTAACDQSQPRPGYA